MKYWSGATGITVLVLLCTLIPSASGQSTHPAIDCDRARQLFQRQQNGQTLSPDDQQYLQQAKAERQNMQRSRALATPPRESTGLIPLCDMLDKNQTYKGQTGGLYGEGHNSPPPELAQAAAEAAKKVQPLDADGHPSPDGKIVLLSVGMSNTTQEFSRFMQLASRDADKSPHVLLVDAAQGAKDSQAWVRDDNVWKFANHRLVAADATPAQVQAVWLKQARIAPGNIGEFPTHAKALQADIQSIIDCLKKTFPNLRLVYLSSRIYAGYAKTILNPEPYAYESAFAVRWVIQAQMKDHKANDPVVLWGPYLWSDGLKGRKMDDLVWKRQDLRDSDGTHPSESGREKVAQLLLKFFKSDPTAKPWFTTPDH